MEILPGSHVDNLYITRFILVLCSSTCRSPLGPGAFHVVSVSLLPAPVNLVHFDNLHCLPCDPVEVALDLVHKGETIFKAIMSDTHARNAYLRANREASYNS
jgi:hypothetical protein